MPRCPFIPRPFVLLFVAALIGCAGEPGGPGNQIDSLAADRRDGPISATVPTSDVGTDQIGLHDLVTDIREGIAPLRAIVGGSPDSARQVAVRLYVTRQEAIEARWGPGSEGAGDGSLARAVARAEHGFHDLMEMLNATPSPDSAAVSEAVAALDERLAEVLRKAEEQAVE